MILLQPYNSIRSSYTLFLFRGVFIIIRIMPSSAAEKTEREARIHQLLSDELLVLVLSWVPPLDLLQSSSRVCRRWNACLRPEWFWKSILRIAKPSTKTTKTENMNQRCWQNLQSLTKEQIQRYLVLCYELEPLTGSDSPEDFPNPPRCLQYGSLLLTQTQAHEYFQDTDHRICAASTTDHINEAIENVLPTQGGSRGYYRVADSSRWWSSQPNTDTESEETLLFALNHPTNLLTQVSIKPLRDPFNRRDVYTWKETIIRAYYIKNTAQSPQQAVTATGDNESSSILHIGNPCSFRRGAAQTDPERRRRQQQQQFFQLAPTAQPDQESIEQVLRNQTPVYENPSRCPVPPGHSDMLHYRLPLGVVANVVTVTLVGKRCEQFQGSGQYFACVEYLDCRGIPLVSSSSSS